MCSCHSPSWLHLRHLPFSSPTISPAAATVASVVPQISGCKGMEASTCSWPEEGGGEISSWHLRWGFMIYSTWCQREEVGPRWSLPVSRIWYVLSQEIMFLLKKKEIMLADLAHRHVGSGHDTCCDGILHRLGVRCEVGPEWDKVGPRWRDQWFLLDRD
jgi:hypothetical protein